MEHTGNVLLDTGFQIPTQSDQRKFLFGRDTSLRITDHLQHQLLEVLDDYHVSLTNPSMILHLMALLSRSVLDSTGD